MSSDYYADFDGIDEWEWGPFLVERFDNPDLYSVAVGVGVSRISVGVSVSYHRSR